MILVSPKVSFEIGKENKPWILSSGQVIKMRTASIYNIEVKCSISSHQIVVLVLTSGRRMIDNDQDQCCMKQKSLSVTWKPIVKELQQQQTSEEPMYCLADSYDVGYNTHSSEW